jgi:Ca-activated chloride channel family protein
MPLNDALVWLHDQGIELRRPELLWALLLIPLLALAYAAAGQHRRHVAGAYRVRRPGMYRSPGRVARLLSMVLLLAGLAALITGFARPVVPRQTPDDHATVVVVLDASTAMRATDVQPTRFEVAKRIAQGAIGALPDRLQVALVAYARTAYILEPPTHDHGAATLALHQARTTDGAALGDALAVALATVPLRDEPGASAPSATAPSSGTAPSVPRVPAAIVLIASGALDQGRPPAEPAANAQEAGIPIYVVPVGPAASRAAAGTVAPFDPVLLSRLAQATGGRALSNPSARDWRRIFDQIGSDVTVERQPQEVGHLVGAGGLAAGGLSMLISLLTSRRLI